MGNRELTPLGIRIKKRLIDVGKTQAQLALEVGTSAMYLNLIMYGDRSGKTFLPKIKRLLQLEDEIA